MKIRVKFSKLGPVKYVGHLDTMRLFQRAIKVAKLPVAYSQGFSPHSLVYFALPLSVGMSSYGEYMEIVMNSDISAEEVKERLSRVMVKGIEILDTFIIEDKGPSLMSLVQGATYEMYLKLEEGSELSADCLCKILDESQELIVMKKGKKGIAPVDIKPFIVEASFEQASERIRILLTAFAGSSRNLSPELFIKALVGEQSYELEVMRRELYTGEGDELVPISVFGRVNA